MIAVFSYKGGSLLPVRKGDVGSDRNRTKEDK